MTTLAEQWIEEGLQRGLRPGMDVGIKEGMQKGPATPDELRRIHRPQ